MKYCQDCGAGHECDAAAPDRTSDAVRIAEIERDRDIKLAQISARQDRDWNDSREAIAETEADAITEAAAVEAEIIGDAIEAAGLEEPAPVIIDQAPPADDEPDADELPPVDGSPVPEPAAGKRVGLGMW